MVAARWWMDTYQYEYLGMLENMLVFVKPNGLVGDEDLWAYMEKNILNIYEDWAKKSGIKSTISRVLWVDGDVERGLIEETIRNQNPKGSYERT